MSRLENNTWIDDPIPECSPTRADYLNKKCTHTEYYRAINKTAGVSYRGVSEALSPARKALATGDEHLNSIPLSVWDLRAEAVCHALTAALKRHGDSWSLCDGVCCIKQAVLQAIEEGPPSFQIINAWDGGKGGRRVVFETPLAGNEGRNACFAWIHNNTCFSFDEATKNQGYIIEDLLTEEATTP